MFHHAGTQKSKHCTYCGRRRLCEMQGVSVVHGFLTVLTCGLWLPVALYKFLSPQYRCTRCGTTCR